MKLYLLVIIAVCLVTSSVPATCWAEGDAGAPTPQEAHEASVIVDRLTPMIKSKLWSLTVQDSVAGQPELRIVWVWWIAWVPDRDFEEVVIAVSWLRDRDQLSGAKYMVRERCETCQPH